MLKKSRMTVPMGDSVPKCATLRLDLITELLSLRCQPFVELILYVADAEQSSVFQNLSSSRLQVDVSSKMMLRTQNL